MSFSHLFDKSQQKEWSLIFLKWGLARYQFRSGVFALFEDQLVVRADIHLNHIPLDKFTL